jgi:hypothetical protein
MKKFIGDISFLIFLWANNMTEREHWETIYQQEKECREGKFYNNG